MPTCNISGEVNIGANAFFGTGAKIINRINVGSDAVIGAGAVVVSDIPDRATAVGVPAKVIKIADDKAATVQVNYGTQGWRQYRKYS